MLWKQKLLNYLLKSPFVYLNLIGLTKTEDVGINFYFINVTVRIRLIVQEISNCDTRVADGDVVNG
jgi:adenine specific DNA methylase Mod